MKRISLAVAMGLAAMVGAGAHAIVPRDDDDFAGLRAASSAMREIAAPNRGRARPGHGAAAQKRAAIKARNLRLHPRR